MLRAPIVKRLISELNALPLAVQWRVSPDGSVSSLNLVADHGNILWLIDRGFNLGRIRIFREPSSLLRANAFPFGSWTRSLADSLARVRWCPILVPAREFGESPASLCRRPMRRRIVDTIPFR